MALDGKQDKHSKHSKRHTSGVNLAPVEPLRQFVDGRSGGGSESSLAQIIRELHLSTKDQNLQARREIAEMGRLMSNLRSGKLVMRRDPVHGSFALLKPLPTQSRQDTHVYPLAQLQSSQLTSVWGDSNPRVVPKHFGNTNEAQIQHAYVQQVIDHYLGQCRDERFQENEALSMQDFGTAIYRVEYDTLFNRLTQVVPVISDVTKQLFAGYQYCNACGFESTPDKFAMKGEAVPRCAECGGYDVSNPIEAVSGVVKEVTGHRKVEQGDIRISLERVPAVNWDIRGFVDESPYVHNNFEISANLVASILGVEEVDGDDPDTHFGMRIVNELGTRGGSTPGYGRDNLFGNTEMVHNKVLGCEQWYKPEMYTGLKLAEDEETLSGEVIPKGVPLEKIFKEGLSVVGFNDMETIVSVRDEKCPLRSSVYHIQSFSGIGKGTTDAIEISQELAESHSAALATIKRYGAGGGFAYDKNVFTRVEAKRLLKPGGLAAADMSKSSYSNVNSAITNVMTGELNQSNMLMITQLANLLNICFQTTEMTPGVMDNRVKVDTLGGQQLLQAQATQRAAAPLRMKAHARVKLMEEVICLFRQHIQIPKYFQVADKFALTKGHLISGKDIPERIECEFVRDSELPTNTITKRDNAERMLEKSQFWGVPFAQLIQTEPRLAAWYAEQYQADLPSFNYTEILMRCQQRINQIKELAQGEMLIAEIAGFQPDIGVSAEAIVDMLTPPLAAAEDNHIIKARVISDYLDDDEVAEWPPLVTAAVQALIQRHYALDRDFRYGLQSLELQGQMGLQAAQMQQQAMMQQAMGAQQSEAAMVEEGLSRAAGLVEEEEKFARDQEGKDLDHQRALELEAIRQEGKQRELDRQAAFKQAA